MGEGLKRARAAARATRQPSPLAQAATKVRVAIKAAAADGKLPPYPPQVKFRVRCSRPSRAEEISIYADNVPYPWLVEDGTPDRRTEASLLLESVLLQIARRHFEADGHDSFIHVHFRIAKGE